MRLYTTIFLALVLTVASLTATASAFQDDFRSLDNLKRVENVVQPRAFPRIVTRPDVRINRVNPMEYSPKDTRGYGWFPYIIRLQSGDLLCIYTEGREHGMTDYEARAVASRSKDGGRTWLPAEVIFQRDEWGISPHGPFQAADGAIYMCLLQTKVAGEGKGGSKFATARSADNGKTWQIMDTPFFFHEGRQLSNGEMIFLTEAKADAYTLTHATVIGRYANGKMEWDKVRPHPELGPTSDEWTLTETGNPGELVAMMRNQQQSHFFGVSKSRDYGRTWTPWRESNVYMGPIPSRPNLATMPDGRVIFAYGQRWIGRTYAVVSRDGGDTWDVAHRQTILHSPRDYYYVWDSHYPAIARGEGDTWVGVDYVSSPKKWPEQYGIYGTFIDARYFDDARQGLALTQENLPIHKDTVGYWSFDESSGDFANEPLGANYGELFNAKRVTGKFGRAIDFNGRDSYVMVYDDAGMRLPHYFTLEAWVNPRDTKGERVILSKRPAYTLLLRDGVPVLQIGEGEVVASFKDPLQPGQWSHVVAVYGLRDNYSRVWFFINGKEFYDSGNARMRRGGEDYYPETYAAAIAQNDKRITGGDTFQEYHAKNKSSDNLVIGLDNDLAKGAFDGLIDEAAIHAGALQPAEATAGFNRRTLSTGGVSALIVEKPAGSRWTKFEAVVDNLSADGKPLTSVKFDILDSAGKTLLANASSGADLSGITADRISLSAELKSLDGLHSPVLQSWSVGVSQGAPSVVREPFPDQQAPLTEEKVIEPSKSKAVPL